MLRRRALKILLIVLLAYALVRMTALLVRRFEHEMSLGTDLDALERGKARTHAGLGRAERRRPRWSIGVAAADGAPALDLDITPVLTGAGIAGLAVGFGAQTLVRDIISGFFLILEDQIRVGDAASINGTAGIVEAINLRTVILRDAEGTVHVFPNGAINTLANRSKDFSYYVVDLRGLVLRRHRSCRGGFARGRRGAAGGYRRSARRSSSRLKSSAWMRSATGRSS